MANYTYGNKVITKYGLGEIVDMLTQVGDFEYLLVRHENPIPHGHGEDNLCWYFSPKELDEYGNYYNTISQLQKEVSQLREVVVNLLGGNNAIEIKEEKKKSKKKKEG